MKWVAAFTLFLAFNFSYGQAPIRQYIEGRALKFNPIIKGLPITAYIVEGEIYDASSSKLDSLLKSRSASDFAYVYGFRTDELFPMGENPGKVVIIISLKGRESRKQKRKSLKSAIAKYAPSEIYFDHISKESMDPVLMIDDKLTYFKDCRKRLLKMRVRDIYDITIYNKPVPAEVYGENAKNGLIEIWTYPIKK